MAPESPSPIPEQSPIEEKIDRTAAVIASGVLESPAPQPAAPEPSVVANSMPGSESATPVVEPSTDRVPVPMNPILQKRLDDMPEKAAFDAAVVKSAIAGVNDRAVVTTPEVGSDAGLIASADVPKSPEAPAST